MVDFIKNKLSENLAYSILETLIDEEYPTSFNMEHFKTFTKFSQRVKYCEEHLQRISSGSSRIVYKIDNEKVLKLAKNEKGLAQCRTEIQWGKDNYYDHILAHTFDENPNDLWVEMELARKCSKGDFRKIVGVDINNLNMYLRNFQEQNNGKRRLFSIDWEIEDDLNNNDFVISLVSFMQDANSPAGDLGRLSSYGLVKREGTDSVVIIDYGLTGDIYSSYYS